ncbi:MAG: hypothetical protein ACO1QB_06525 [Verrucomicrobiales bacterium]
MKIHLSLAMLAAAVSLHAGPPPKTKPLPPEPGTPIAVAPAPAPSEGNYVYEQRPITGRPVLIAPEQAKSVLDRFKAAYPKWGNPRIVVYVNRELVDEQSGLKLTSRTEKTQKNTTKVESEFKNDPNAPAVTNNGNAGNLPAASNVTIVGDVRGRNNKVPGKGNVATETEKVANENNYKLNEKAAPTLADRQTVRDVERLFGRPLRMAGANLADQRVAAQLISNGTLKTLSSDGEQANKDREALSKVADVALEILISSRNVVVPEVSGDKTYQVPDIQATAIRLKDAKVLGQTTSTDIIGKDRYAGNIARQFDVREIAEATALALMEDMLLNAEE